MGSAFRDDSGPHNEKNIALHIVTIHSIVKLKCIFNVTFNSWNCQSTMNVGFDSNIPSLQRENILLNPSHMKATSKVKVYPKRLESWVKKNSHKEKDISRKNHISNWKILYQMPRKVRNIK